MGDIAGVNKIPFPFPTDEAQVMANRMVLSEALKSGFFEQTRGVLRSDGDQYCCLGVACTVYGDPWGKLVRRNPIRVPLGHSPNGFRSMFDDIGVPPYWVQHAFGLSGDSINELIQMNDKKMKSFDYIADAIVTFPIFLEHDVERLKEERERTIDLLVVAHD